MKVSIIIPVYKVEDCIEACINSLIAQSYKDLEIILVDDLGGDSSIEKALNLLAKTPFEYKVVRHKKNRGASAARNTGVSEATGASIFFLDSDDTLPRDAIAHLVALQNEYQTEIVVGRADVLDIQGAIQCSCYGNKSVSHLSTTPFDSVLSRDLYATPWGKLINRQWYRENNIQFVEGIMCEDEAWIVLLALHAESVFFSDQIVYHYLLRPGSVMHQEHVTMHAVNSLIKVIELIDGYTTQNKIFHSLKGQVWFLGKIIICLHRVRSCKLLKLGEKLRIYREFYEKYPCLRKPDLTGMNVVRLANIFSSLLPADLALYSAILLGSLWGKNVSLIKRFFSRAKNAFNQC